MEREKGRGGKERGKRRRGEEGKEEKGRGDYQDEGPLTKILNTPLILCLENEMARREITFIQTVLSNKILLSTKIIKLVDECRRHSKPKQCRFRDTMYSMTKKTHFLGFLFMFPQVAQTH